jgi:hypothetical protein
MTETPIPWRVIRAAPDLLEACRFAVGCIEGGDSRGPELALLKLKGAIAKANGEFQPEERKENAAN